jgi:DICT domain-containing protein
MMLVIHQFTFGRNIVGTWGAERGFQDFAAQLMRARALRYVGSVMTGFSICRRGARRWLAMVRGCGRKSGAEGRKGVLTA